jgi:hypothetical protein
VPKWEKKWRGIITSIAVAVGGGFAGCQYTSAQEVEKINRTMEYIQRYEDGSVATARRSINDSLRYIEIRLQKLPDKPNPDDYFMGLGEAIRSGEIKENQIDIVVDFYEGLSVCVRNEICDQTVAMAYFSGDESKNFKDYFGKYISDRRTNNHCYAEGLAWFAAKGLLDKPCKQGM